MALLVIAQAQKAGGVAAFIDAEHALDAGYARKLGVDVDNLLVSQPDTGEQALEITAALVQSGAVDVVVIDSVAALVPKAELEGEMGDSHMGLHARLMSQALRKLTGSVSKTNTCLVFINQVREKIGVMFGNPETTTGGRALKFYSSVRAEVRRIGAIKDGETITGNRTRRRLTGSRSDRSRGCKEHGREVGFVVQLQRRAHRTGTRERAALPEGASGVGAAARR
jgi:recombination protein RecA